MRASAEDYARFIPARLLRRHAADLSPPSAPQAERCAAAVLFVDVIGYTRLTELYSQGGPEGVEKLNAKLKALFTYLEERISEYGGDIMSFAGDSLLAIWSDESNSDLQTAALLAARCGCDAQANLHKQVLGDDRELRLAIGVAAGEALIATVGGVEGQWQYVAAGEAFTAAGTALKRSGAGNVVVGPAAWALIGRDCTGEMREDGYVRLLTTGERSIAPERHEVVPKAGMSAALSSYIPRPVLDYLEAGQSSWLAEFRRVSTLFVSVSGLDYGAAYAVSRLHAVVTAIQVAIERYEGTMTRVIVDDKGTNVLSAWGVPGRQHEDDAARALWAALAIADALRDAGVGCACGITTGRVLCALSGGGSRYEYTVTGEVVNLAARLMVAAQAGVLCDAATRHAASGSFDFEDLAPIPLKGIDTPVPVARPLSSRVRQGQKARVVAVHDAPPARFVGRKAERERLLESLDRLRAGSGTLITIEGEPGIGKSRLISELVQAAEEAGIECLLGAADAIEQGTTYFVWRGILGLIFDRAQAHDGPARRRYLEAQLEEEPGLLGWLPLLEEVIPLGLRPNATTSGMDEQSRGTATSELMLHLLRAALAQSQSIIVLDDVHWMDSMSWDLAARLQRRAQPLVMVLVMRSGQSLRSAAADDMLTLPGIERIALGTLSPEDTESVIGDRLGVRSIAPEILRFVQGKAAGNPLYAEELTYALDDSGFLRIEDAHCTLSVDAKRLEKLKLTATVELVISSRIDRLPPSQQFTLRVASVTGRSFPARLVCEIHPIESNTAAIVSHLETLTALDLIVPDPESPEPRYLFKHVIMRDVAYHSFAPEDRKGLHRRIGTWYEDEHEDDRPTVYPLLAYHWYEAKDAPKASDYLHKAGEQAFNRYANREAVGFLEQALEVIPELGKPAAGMLHVSCERLLGYALLWLGDWPESEAHLQKSFALVGSPIPSSRGGLLKAVLAQLAYGACIRFLGPRFTRRSAQATDAERYNAIGLLRLGHVAYFNGENILASYTSLRILNFAEHREPCRETALIYSAMTNAAAMVPLHGLARRYMDLALTAAKAAADPYVESEAKLFVSIYGAGIGDWEAGIARLTEAATLSGTAGAARQTDQCMLTRGYMYFHSGDLETAHRDFTAAAAGGIERADRQLTAWGLLGMSRARLGQNRTSEALQALGRAAPLATDWLGRVELHGQMALAHLRRPDYRRSLRAAHKGLKAVLETRPSSFSTLTGTAGVAESLLGLWAAARRGEITGEAALRRAARTAIRVLSSFARIFPIGSPQALLQRGVYCYMTGRRRRAHVLWQRALEAAARYRMLHEEARIVHVIAQYATGEEAEEAREREIALCERLGIAMTAAQPMGLGDPPEPPLPART